MRRLAVPLLLACLLPACGSADAPPSWYNRTPPDAATTDATADGDTDGPSDAGMPDEGVADAAVEVDAPEDAARTSCEFGYASVFQYAPITPLPGPTYPGLGALDDDGVDEIVHAEPPPPYTYRLGGPWREVSPDDLVMPGYEDTWARFERSENWDGTRCFETPAGVKDLTEEDAYDLYRSIAERTTGLTLETKPEFRNVIGLRGMYPGQFAWNGNEPDRFNDTLVLLWIETSGAKRVLEFHAHTDTGAYDFGYHNSSSLRPNRRYRYINGWHNTYNALHIDEIDYRVRDDANKNAHWDSDRNGWLPPAGADDHDRTGSGHNIHTCNIDADLGSLAVNIRSAGCQVIPGMSNWTKFITNAWTNEGDRVDYYLLDARDIAPEVWNPCTPDGTHDCPLPVTSIPFSDTRDSSTGGSSFNTYSCSAADESGPELVYVLTIDRSGMLTISVDCAAPVDVDIHLLDGDDANACLARGDTSLEYDITPGRYLIVADTFVEGGTALSGAFTLNVDLQ